MASMRIGTRLALSFALLLGLLLAVATVSLQRFRSLAGVTQTIVEVQTTRAFLAQSANQHAQTAANDLLKLLLTSAREQRVLLYGDMDRELAASDQAVESIAQTVQSAEDAQQLRQLNQLRNHYDDYFRETVELIELKGPAGAREHFDHYTKKALDELLEASSTMAAVERQRMGVDLQQLQIAQAHAVTMLVVMALAALLAGIALSVYMSRSIVRPVREAIGVAEAVAAGNLMRAVPTGRGDEVGKLLRALGVMRDSIVSREDKILRLAYEDNLTGLPNRTRLLEHFERLPHDARGAVLVLDIDRFGMINNALGHSVGDRLLREIGQRLLGMPGTAPFLLVRLWGDEFAFLLEGANRDQAIGFAQAVVEHLRQPLTLDDQRIDVSGSLGIALYPQDDSDLTSLLRRAALAMRAAKQRYRSHALVSDLAVDPPHENLTLIGEMRDALARHEFVAFVQPKYDLARREVTAVEALLRWRHPTKGLVPPARFIPFAEQTGFIHEITPWLLEHVMAQAASWRADGWALVPSINLSALDLLDPGLTGLISDLLTRYALAPDSICLEITESALMDEPELALRHLNQLADLGVKLSIDDYGTGQASLAYLKTLPVHELKMDRAFISNITTLPKNAAIVRSTVMLSHELGLSVVAEGAETSQELDWLRGSGCDMVQGYVIAKPMPAPELLAWLTLQRAGVAA